MPKFSMAEAEAFCAGLVHAINNPLTYLGSNLTSLARDIEGLCQLLEAQTALLRSLPPEYAAAVTVLEAQRRELYLEPPGEILRQLVADCSDGVSEVNRIAAVIRALPSAVELSGPPVPFSLHEVVSTAVARARTLHARERVADVRLSHRAAPGLMLNGVPAQIIETVEAMIDNAVHSGQAEGMPIFVVVTDERGFAVIDVIDKGPGVLEARTDDIFQPFFTTRRGAVGMGLTTGRRFAELHEGRLIWIGSSHPDFEGSAGFIRLRLPIDGAAGRMR